MRAIRDRARGRLMGFCRVCPRCDGRACAGEVPGMGGAGGGEAFKENIRALASWKLNMRTLHAAANPDTGFNLFGAALTMPVMAAPMAGAAYNLGGAMEEAELARALHEGCAGAGTIAWCGDGANPDFLSLGLDAIAARQGRGIPTIKPRGLDALLARIRLAETAGALAVAVDVDTAGFFSMTSQGQPVGPLSPETLSVLAGSTKLPLIVKGVMTPDEAVVAMNAGAAGIVVSNHGGRVLEACPGTAAVLPAIAAEVRGRAPLLMDGGIRSGADVLKALALGADAVLVGRPLIVAAAGGGAEGVALYLNNLRADLASAMVLTGTADVRDVPPRVVTRNAS